MKRMNHYLSNFVPSGSKRQQAAASGSKRQQAAASGSKRQQAAN
jgi:hypothetical protein